MDGAEFEAMTTAAERAGMGEDQILVPPDEWNTSHGFISMFTDVEQKDAYGRDWNDADQAANKIEMSREEAVQFLREHEEALVESNSEGVE